MKKLGDLRLKWNDIDAYSVKEVVDIEGEATKIIRVFFKGYTDDIEFNLDVISILDKRFIKTLELDENEDADTGSSAGTEKKKPNFGLS